MRLADIMDDPASSLSYMEQYVNAGSPSGFTQRNQPTRRYAPGAGQEPFSLWACVTDQARAREFGNLPRLPPPAEGQNEAAWIYLHPDMAAHPSLRRPWLTVTDTTGPIVVPTSSGRTVQFVDTRPRWYLKLHYAGLLGRIDRSLPWLKAIAGVEISQHLESAVTGQDLPPQLHILRELGARVINVDATATWGMVVRHPQPFGRRAADIHALIPVFSLFSHDRLRPDEPLLIYDLLHVWGPQAQAYLREGVLASIVHCYFSLVRSLGLQPELNAQNVLLGLDGDGAPVAVVLRDLMGVEKDLTLRAELGLSLDFSSMPYKCLDRDANADLYAVRHSFAFDFKVGEYVLAPIIAGASRTHLEPPEKHLTTYIRQLVARHADSLPGDYFPDEVWYRHPQTLLDRHRPYERMDGPRYR